MNRVKGKLTVTMFVKVDNAASLLNFKQTLKAISSKKYVSKLLENLPVKNPFCIMSHAEFTWGRLTCLTALNLKDKTVAEQECYGWDVLLKYEINCII